MRCGHVCWGYPAWGLMGYCCACLSPGIGLDITACIACKKGRKDVYPAVTDSSTTVDLKTVLSWSTTTTTSGD